jgi:hypothetical protein
MFCTLFPFTIVLSRWVFLVRFLMRQFAHHGYSSSTPLTKKINLSLEFFVMSKLIYSKPNSSLRAYLVHKRN